MILLKRYIGKCILPILKSIEQCILLVIKEKLAFYGQDVVLYPGVSIDNPQYVSIGNHSHIGERCHLRGGGRIVIGEWCQIANHTIIATGNHPIDGGRYYGRTIVKDIVIGNNVWIGSGAIILPGVIIEDNSVIAAGAVVTKCVRKNTIVGGVPARKIGDVPLRQ